MSETSPKEFSLRTAMDVAKELLEQPALFSEFDGLPGLSPVPGGTTAVARYTGERSTSSQYDERNLKVGALRLLGASDREIEQACGVTRRTIPLILAALEKAGRITPLKERLAVLTGQNAERANIALRALLDQVHDDSGSIELAAMIKAVSTAMGISVEKYLLTTGQATEIVETRSGAGRAEFEAWWKEQVIPVQTVAGESASAATPPISEEIRTNDGARHGSGTADSTRLDGSAGSPGPDRGGGDAPPATGPGTPTG